MSYWIDSDIFRERVKDCSFTYDMIDQTKDGKSYPNIQKLKAGDKVIFVNSLVAYADGVIKSINFNLMHSGNRSHPYPVTMVYNKIKIWKKDVSLTHPDVIKFLATVHFKNSKHGTFLKDTSDKTIKISPQRLAAEFQRINEEIFNYLKGRGI